MKKIFLMLFIMSSMIGCDSIRDKSEKIDKCIVVGIDGLSKKCLLEGLKSGNAPNLEKLSREGTIVDIVNVRVTDTKSGWAQVLTGYDPEITGVSGNWDYRPIPKGYTVFERLEEYFYPLNFITAAFIGKFEHLDYEPPRRELIDVQKEPGQSYVMRYESIVIEDGKKYRLIPGGPYYYTKDNVDVFINGLGKTKNVLLKSLALLAQYHDRPFLFFIHFETIDLLGHKYGEYSEQSRKGLMSVDAAIGEIINSLKDHRIYNRTMVYVVSDHGFDENSKEHYEAPYIFLITNDKKVIRHGDLRDITPTILTRFGVDIDSVKPRLSGYSLTEDCEKYRPE